MCNRKELEEAGRLLGILFLFLMLVAALNSKHKCGWEWSFIVQNFSFNNLLVGMHSSFGAATQRGDLVSSDPF